MARFSVPQFIEEKSKIIGPLTLVQFFYIGAGAGIAVLAFYAIQNFAIKFFIIALSVGISVALAFVNLNGQTLPKLLLSALNFWQKPSRYVWKRDLPTQSIDVTSLQKINELRRGMSLQGLIKVATLKVTTGSLPFFNKPEKKPMAEKTPQYQDVRFMTGETRRVKRVDY